MRYVLDTASHVVQLCFVGVGGKQGEQGRTRVVQRVMQATLGGCGVSHVDSWHTGSEVVLLRDRGCATRC